MFRIERLDGTIDGLGDEVRFSSEQEAWDNAEIAFGNDPAGPPCTWLRVVQVNETKTCIFIEDVEFPTDTDDEISAAKSALRKAGLKEAEVFVGDGQDSYPNGQILFA